MRRGAFVSEQGLSRSQVSLARNINWLERVTSVILLDAQRKDIIV